MSEPQMATNEDALRRRALREIPRRLATHGKVIGAPSEYIGHSTLILAFKRGVLMGMDPELEQLPPWYMGEGTRDAYQRGWRVGRARLKGSTDQK